ncbi:uncharacterized protein CTRU02_202794 [Colletotrichum truncatum]|uniref:Uncharacterized protein n=1 Tax=Colletotrichum truncatum TaxID=5467 RepID=A0ACC3ZL95_COLTU|nr:uncharacterized protein CTRU02_10719 [Colletotrichum truncatum]KAF6787020.1 hypothetical protein CTRU02_10719 [Colletotrichum truncatum]
MDLTNIHHALTSAPTTPGMSAFRIAEVDAAPPILKITSLLQQIPDVIFEIASQLPPETALCLALTCKPLYVLLFHRTLRRLTRRRRHLFLFTLMRDLGTANHSDHYYCHTCSKICVWRCPLGRTHGPWEKCLPIKLETLHHDLNVQKHACVGKGYFTQTIPEVEDHGSCKGVALHTARTGWCKCCEYSGKA